MSDASDKPEDTARAAGRGGLAVAGAKIYFILIGFVQQTLLTRVLGTDGYGTFSRAQAWFNVADNVVITSSIQGASRTVAEAKPEEQPGAQRGTLEIHALLALPVAGAFFFLAPLGAAALGAPHIAPHLRIASLIVLGYALYTPFVGTLNGRRRFGAQAVLDVTYATLRTVAMLGGAWLWKREGAGPLGTVSGFALAALTIVPFAAVVAGVGKRGPGGPKLSAYLSLIAPLALGQLFFNVLLQSDITLLGYFASGTAANAGLAGAEAIAAADRSVGIYKACQLFAFLPYQLLVSVTFILFPLLAKAHAGGDAQAVKTYVRMGMRLALVLTGAMVAVLVGLAPGLLGLVFPREIAEAGATTLRVLAVGQGAFALFAIASTVLTSLHREVWTLALNVLATVFVVGAAFVFVPGSPLGGPIATRAAMATSTALFAALVVAGALVVRFAGALLPALAVVRVLVALVAAAALPLWLGPSGKLATVALAAVVGALYLGVLVATGELGKADLSLVRRVLGKRR